MIRIRVIEHDGHMMMDIHGHASHAICASISAIFQTAAAGMGMMARTYPKEVGIAHSSDSPEETKRDYRKRERKAATARRKKSR